MKTWVLLFITTLIAYGGSLRYGFSQDDYFHLVLANANSFTDFLNFFNPMIGSWIFYRPLSTQIPYYLAMYIFTLSYAPLSLHIFMLLLQSLNAYLVTKIGENYLKKRFALFLGIIYSVSSVHFLSLYYIGAIQQLLSTVFSLLAIYSLLKQKTRQEYLGAYTLLALLSKELAIRLSPILLIIAYIRYKDWKKAFLATRWSWLVTALYLVLRIFTHAPVASEYELSLSPLTTVATVMWYGLFTLGFPETLLQYGLSHGLVDYGRFITDNPFTRIPILLSAIFLAIIILHRALQKPRNFIWIALAALSLLPVLFLPTHRYPHYLDFSIIFLGIWIFERVKNNSFKVWAGLGVVTLGMICSIKTEVRTHWTTGRALMASRATQFFIDKKLCTYDSVRLTGEGDSAKELSYSLSGENGPNIICGHPLTVRYGSEPGFTEEVFDITKVVKP